MAQDELARQKQIAARVTITRDDWGIAHIHGKSDADAVFGMVYAQAEDDFGRVETNYLTSLGRTAEAEGESAIWTDLRQKLFIDPVVLKAEYAKSPAWLKALMDGWADGLNYYLATHPGVHPRVITHFEPWMALSFSEGSIGGDIEKSQAAKGWRHFTAATSRQPFSRPITATAFPSAPTASPSPRAFAQRPCPAADQPAHLFLFPLRAADDQRRGAERLWRGDLGPVLHLSGLQPAHRLDAHLQRRRYGRRVRRDRQRKGRQAFLSLWQGRAALHGAK